MRKKIECLLIDDDEDDCEIFLMCLSKISHHIHCTTMGDAPEAIAFLKNTTDYLPDYIFLDVNMPKMNGIEGLKEIKSIERFSKSKIFMYSTTSDSHSVLDTKNIGAFDFLIKPYKTKELIEQMNVIFASDLELMQNAAEEN